MQDFGGDLRETVVEEERVGEFGGFAGDDGGAESPTMCVFLLHLNLPNYSLDSGLISQLLPLQLYPTLLPITTFLFLWKLRCDFRSLHNLLHTATIVQSSLIATTTTLKYFQHLATLSMIRISIGIVLMSVTM